MREHRRRARGVVVGAVVDLSGLVLAGERVAGVAAAEVIVVRAERDPRLARRRSTGVVAGRYATTLWPVCFSRTTARVTRDA